MDLSDKFDMFPCFQSTHQGESILFLSKSGTDRPSVHAITPQLIYSHLGLSYLYQDRTDKKGHALFGTDPYRFRVDFTPKSLEMI